MLLIDVYILIEAVKNIYAYIQFKGKFFPRANKSERQPPNLELLTLFVIITASTFARFLAFILGNVL